ncbi:hypothetical protein TYRP_015508 [Tyrophagus putrescentiae]|nr:hypothetical protein TYRP_015508 [Tyrophagus putrescentiae]
MQSNVYRVAYQLRGRRLLDNVPHAPLHPLHVDLLRHAAVVNVQRIDVAVQLRFTAAAGGTRLRLAALPLEVIEVCVRLGEECLQVARLEAVVVFHVHQLGVDRPAVQCGQGKTQRVLHLLRGRLKELLQGFLRGGVGVLLKGGPRSLRSSGLFGSSSSCGRRRPISGRLIEAGPVKQRPAGALLEESHLAKDLSEEVLVEELVLIRRQNVHHVGLQQGGVQLVVQLVGLGVVFAVGTTALFIARVVNPIPIMVAAVVIVADVDVVHRRVNVKLKARAALAAVVGATGGGEGAALHWRGHTSAH